MFDMRNIIFVFILYAGLVFPFILNASDKPLLNSQLTEEKKDAVLLTDVTGDGKPDILETWWNGKRCRWFDENGDMKDIDRRGDMTGDAMQIDIDSDGFYDSYEDMNIKWVDQDRDGRADLMCVAINPSETQKELWGNSSHYMYFMDVDGDGVNHYINWNDFSFNAWRHKGGCNFSPDYNGDSIFIKTHLPPWALEDPRYNWENPFAFYDFDDDGCTEMTVRYLNHHKINDQTYTYCGIVEQVQMGFDLDNDSQKGQEQSFDMSLGFAGGQGLDYRQYMHKYPALKAPDWVLKYYQYTNYRQIDELIYTPHDKCFDLAMQVKWANSEFVFDEDDDDHRWERVEFYKQGNPYQPRPPKGKTNNSVVRGTQTDTLGDRAEWDQDFSGKGQLYIGKWDGKLHLYGAETGVWLVDDGSYFGSGSAPHACSPEIAPNVKELVQYKDTNEDGFLDLITYDYDGDKTVDLEVSLLQYSLEDPELIVPAEEKWEGLHKIFTAIAKLSWADAQMLYRSAWRAGMTDPELEDMAIASSTWEKYHRGYWLKEILFRKLYKKFDGDEKKCDALKRAYFTGDFKTMCNIITPNPIQKADIVVYGDAAVGVTAAVQSARMGKSVILVSQYDHLGGMTSSGLGWTDIGNTSILGGISREFYHRVHLHYQNPDAWFNQSKDQFPKMGQGARAFDSKTELASVFEPKVAEMIFDHLVAETGVKVVKGCLNLKNGVTMDGQRITAMHLEDGADIGGKMFIDASYEGDLLYVAGITFRVGREANTEYGESGNGITGDLPKNQLPHGINPYVIPGDPASGLLPGVNPAMGGGRGDADHRLQAFCYRMVMTDVPANRITVSKPADYNEKDYEILFRAIEAGQASQFFKISPIPNRKTDSNNDSGISCDFIGANYSRLPPNHPDYWDWTTLDHKQRQAVADKHRRWQIGLLWTLQNHNCIPEEIRKDLARWGFPKDEFTDNGNWPYNLYVREGRRMVSDFVMTEAHIRGESPVSDSVGMGAYTMDSHNTQRFVSDEMIRNEGDIQIAVDAPYKISYRAIIPPKGQCENLLVPWCLSSTHIAFGSIRMEPVGMILGQSAGTAAVLALDDNLAVQELDYNKLSARLRTDGQILSLSSENSSVDPPKKNISQK
jgi:hypothetical protein